jgi:hypothetical protein
MFFNETEWSLVWMGSNSCVKPFLRENSFEKKEVIDHEKGNFSDDRSYGCFNYYGWLS